MTVNTLVAEDAAADKPTVDKSGERIRAMFGEIAHRYDLLNRLLSLGIDKYWRWRAVRIVPPRGDGPILDLCTGTGDLAIAYLRAAPRGARVVGADFCHPMLTIADKKCAANSEPSRIAWLEADCQELP